MTVALAFDVSVELGSELTSFVCPDFASTGLGLFDDVVNRCDNICLRWPWNITNMEYI